MQSIDLNSPQLGEHVWHVFTNDPTIDAVSHAHRKAIESIVDKNSHGIDWRQARFLEVGAYRHYSAHLLSSKRGAECVLTDISAAALRDGRAHAEANGVKSAAKLVVADFHDFPFSDRYFDIVFIASSVHHTRHPERVLREMFRVLKPDGLLLIDNEPCARACCFHAFVSNRAESFTPFEAQLHADGLLSTLSSPFWGARPEMLFGMVENDRIPLTLYQSVFEAEGEILSRSIANHSLVGPFERQLLQLVDTGHEMHEKVTELLLQVVAQAERHCGVTDRLLGYRLPTLCEVHELSATIVAMLSARPAPEQIEDWNTALFGGALQAVVRKRMSDHQVSETLFRRAILTEADGLIRESTEYGSVLGQIGKPLLPDIHIGDDPNALARVFPGSDWLWIRESHGAGSMVNLGARSTVMIPRCGARRILLMRYFAVVTDGNAYHVRMWACGRLLGDHRVVLQESRLMRAWIPADCDELKVEICNLNETHAAVGWQLRIGVLQIFEPCGPQSIEVT